MTDLATRYLGLELRSPLVASASPLSGTADGVRRLADGGVGAVVLPSLFEEQLRQQAARDARGGRRGGRQLRGVAVLLPGGRRAPTAARTAT